MSTDTSKGDGRNVTRRTLRRPVTRSVTGSRDREARSPPRPFSPLSAPVNGIASLPGRLIERPVTHIAPDPPSSHGHETACLVVNDREVYARDLVERILTASHEQLELTATEVSNLFRHNKHAADVVAEEVVTLLSGDAQFMQVYSMNRTLRDALATVWTRGQRTRTARERMGKVVVRLIGFIGVGYYNTYFRPIMTPALADRMLQFCKWVEERGIDFARAHELVTAACCDRLSATRRGQRQALNLVPADFNNAMQGRTGGRTERPTAADISSIEKNLGGAELSIDVAGHIWPRTVPAYLQCQDGNRPIRVTGSLGILHVRKRRAPSLDTTPNALHGRSPSDGGSDTIPWDQEGEQSPSASLSMDPPTGCRKIAKTSDVAVESEGIVFQDSRVRGCNATNRTGDIYCKLRDHLTDDILNNPSDIDRALVDYTRLVLLHFEDSANQMPVKEQFKPLTDNLSEMRSSIDRLAVACTTRIASTISNTTVSTLLAELQTEQIMGLTIVLYGMLLLPATSCVSWAEQL